MIRVLHGYRGAPSKERYIAAGDYADDDERLFGLAQYLVANGHAVVLAEEGGGDEPPPQQGEPQEAREVPDSGKMTLDEIKAYLGDLVAFSDDPEDTRAHIDAMRASERLGKGRAGAEALFAAAYEELGGGDDEDGAIVVAE
jgi:hypothetical protein